MVRPPKPSDIKKAIPLPKSNLKILKPDLEERFRTEAPIHNRIRSEQFKNPLTSATPGTSLQAKVKAKNTSLSDKTKPASPKMSKLSKTQSDRPASKSIHKRESIAQSKSHTIKPGTPTTKARKPSTKKKRPVEAKSDPMNRLLKITEAEDPDRTSLPVGEQLSTITGKNTNPSKLTKIGKVVATAKKVMKKSSLKKPPKDSPKVLTLNAKQEESDASLTTHFRMSYLGTEINSVPNTSKFATGKKRKTSTVQKKIAKAKADQEDNTKETKNKRKSKLHNSKLLDRVLSVDSVPVFSLREIKHNDSFIISARKLQKSSSERRDSKPDCLKLSARTSLIRTRAKTDNLPLKSCLKKTEHKIGEFFRPEGKMRLHETFHPAQII